MKKIFVFTSIVLLLSACNQKKELDINQIKGEILKAENAFQKMCAEQGVGAAFYHFAGEDAVIKRRDSIISGKEAIKNFYSGEFFKTAALSWAPDYIGLSENGDMAYTYGKFNWNAPDSTGEMHLTTGVFHTIWKKQKNGEWKYVWD